LNLSYKEEEAKLGELGLPLIIRAEERSEEIFEISYEKTRG
jgi:hypothetical protein